MISSCYYSNHIYLALIFTKGSVHLRGRLRGLVTGISRRTILSIPLDFFLGAF